MSSIQYYKDDLIHRLTIRHVPRFGLLGPEKPTRAVLEIEYEDKDDLTPMELPNKIIELGLRLQAMVEEQLNGN